MVQRRGGFRRKTRHKLRKPKSERGKIKIRDFMQEFKEDQKVILKAEPAYQKGMYFPRFHAKQGIVKGKKGNCYEIAIKDGKKDKLLIVHPIHLKKNE